MASIAPPKAIEPLAAVSPAPSAESGAPEAEPRIAQQAAALHAEAAQRKLSVTLDADAGRFVQTLTDVSTAETLRRYPSESQLAYARAVMAYLRAQLGR
jgi:uncharacterized FlaG/YvyC family protein